MNEVENRRSLGSFYRINFGLSALTSRDLSLFLLSRWNRPRARRARKELVNDLHKIDSPHSTTRCLASRTGPRNFEIRVGGGTSRGNDNYDRGINYNEGGAEWAYRVISALFRRFKAPLFCGPGWFRNCEDRQVLKLSALIMLSLLIRPPPNG